jgi:hypothetical protein
MQLTDWLLVEVALLFIGLTKYFGEKSGFNQPSVVESPLSPSISEFELCNPRYLLILSH